eukprot:m.386939 g.386939  ORF g.386939 m.386939 type:complete len:255 (+) comp20060_c0_seq3:30-794(+)
MCVCVCVFMLCFCWGLQDAVKPNSPALSNTFVLMRSLTGINIAIQAPLLQCFFVGHYIVAWSSCAVYTWNLLTCSVWWKLKMPVASVHLDRAGGRFAVITGTPASAAHRRCQPSTQSRVVLFAPDSPVPIQTLQFATSLGLRVPAAAAFVTSKATVAWRTNCLKEVLVLVPVCMIACVCACACLRVRVHMIACVGLCMCVGVLVWLCICVCMGFCLRMGACLRTQLLTKVQVLMFICPGEFWRVAFCLGLQKAR